MVRSPTRGRGGLAAVDRETQVLSELDTNVKEDTSFTDEEEDEEYPGIVTKQAKKKHFIRSSDNSDDDDEGYMSPLACSDSDDEGKGEAKRASKKSKAKGTEKSPKAKQKQRRRRRSSARFLRLSGRFGNDAEDDDLQEGAKKNENLGEVYRQAIKLNAENKINAGNSWGLRLIENMDRFTYDDEDANYPREVENLDGSSNKRVNFTKASCTLDASVKIYGYRVDDVHLTSYKVLANLNRTDNGGSTKKKGQKDATENESGGTASSGGRKTSARAGPTDTLESNMANINMSKLESAPDIDPLFRKMSKAFDEGGAKGLLLNNLSVAGDGCRIEFDSKDDSVADSTSAKLTDQSDGSPEKADHAQSYTSDSRQEGDIEISCLGNVLSGLLSGSSMDSLQLVPQLRTLRADFAVLESEGYVGKENPENKKKRYGVSEEEEKEAEQCIHREALERSQRSVMNVSFAASLLGGGGHDDDDDDEDGYGPTDFGGDDDDDDGVGFTSFQANDVTRDSCLSQNSNPSESFAARPSIKGRASTAMMLDALCSSDALTQGGEYEYFSQAALEKISSGNQWAGSAHWKKSEKIRRKRAKKTATDKQKESKKKRSSKQRTFLDFGTTSYSFLEALLKKGAPKKGRSDPLQLTQAAKKKQQNESNLLPPDAGIGVEQLSRLFMRPRASLRPPSKDLAKGRKSVGFHDVEFHVAFDDGADDSFENDDNDGPGFDFAGAEDGNFGDADDYVVEEIEGVRKVEKIKIGYATVAKKVDVKRLKKDLWAEVEAKVAQAPLEVSGCASAKENQDKSKDEAELVEQISFKDTVKELESSQGQSEVTVSFYFICILHLANEKGLKLDSTGHNLVDFAISRDDGSAPKFGTLPTATDEVIPVEQRVTRKKEAASYHGEDESSCGDDESFEE